MLTVCAPRLNLVSATLQHFDAELKSPASLSALLGVTVPEGWPPGEYDRSAIETFRARLAENPTAAGWLSWYAVMRPSGGAPALLVGSGGYFGPPDAEGTVEIGYSTVPSFEGRGVATEIASALTLRALSMPGVKRVIAHVRPDNPASIRVLVRCGFTEVGPGREPGTVRYERRNRG
jgi:[ribosomal protein S5]-alanine N-acetyltransferase